MPTSLIAESGGKSTGPSVEVIGVSKSYPATGLIRRLMRGRAPASADALSDVTFTIEPGEMVGLLGPNGAGKTTLLKIISTMLYPTSGEVRVCGLSVSRDATAVRRRIGLVTSDERSFYWRLTGRQNLEFFAVLYDVRPEVARKRIPYLFENLDLAHAADKPFYAYSSGMKQKLAIARGLLSDPALLLYDEPTRALDPLSTRGIRHWLKENQRKLPATAHLIATNQMDEAAQLCDRMLVLNRGRLVASGTIEMIRSIFQEHSLHRVKVDNLSPREEFTVDPAEGLIGISSRDVDGICEIRVETEKGTAGLNYVLRQILARGGVVLSCDTVEMPLEEIICSILLQDQAAHVGAGKQEVKA